VKIKLTSAKTELGKNVTKKSTSNKLVINIQSDVTPDWIKNRQGITSKLPLLQRNSYSVSQSNPSELYLPGRKGTVTVHVPCMGGEQIVQV
jgi:hypothetical protein